MPKKSNGTGLFALLTGAIAGAAAVFFSDQDNRKMVKKEFTKVEKGAEKMTREIRKDPKKFAKKVGSNGRKLATKMAKEVKKDAPIVRKNAMRMEKNVARRVSSSPALKAVGKKIAMRK